MTVRDELEALYARDGFLTAEQVVAAAGDPTSPLHDQFEWDDKVAGHRHRLHQARSLIRRMKIEVVVEPERSVRVRAYVSVPAMPKPEYVATTDALADPVKRDLVVQQALKELSALRNKYRALIDIDAVIQAAVAPASTGSAA